MNKTIDVISNDYNLEEIYSQKAYLLLKCMQLSMWAGQIINACRVVGGNRIELWLENGNREIVGRDCDVQILKIKQEKDDE